jgi:hypothetical protein
LIQRAQTRSPPKKEETRNQRIFEIDPYFGLSANLAVSLKSLRFNPIGPWT